MIFDEKKLPKDTGASDWMDSSRLAGMMALFRHPQAPNVRYYFAPKGPVRYPFGKGLEKDPKDFSRDQAVCLAAGLKMQHGGTQFEYLNQVFLKSFAPNGDVLSPSVRNHFQLCAGYKGTLIGHLWLMLDIWYNAIFTPMREPNQLIAMCVIAGSDYVRKYKRSCDWKKAIREYWSGWRGEAEFAEFLINELSVI